MKRINKWLSLLLVLAMVLALAACGGNNNAPADNGSNDAVNQTEGNDQPDSQTGEENSGTEATDVNQDLYPDQDWDILTAKYETPVGITMWIPNSATSSMGVGIQALADAFNAQQAEEHPGKNITVTVEFQDKSSTLNEKLQAAILAGNNPVISAVGVSSVPLYEARSLDLRNVFTYEELQGQVQGMLQYSLYNGKFMLNPYFPSASNILIVNKTLMESKGVELPTAQSIMEDPDGSDWTWETFREAVKAATDADNGVYGFATNSLDPVGMMFQQGGALYNSDVTELMFVDDDRFAKGLEFWRSLVTDGSMINPNSRANHGSIIVSEFYEQKVGMIYSTSSNIVKFTEEAEKGGYEIAVLPFPKETQFYTNQGGSGIIILDNRPAEEMEAAAEFLRWLNQPENVSQMCAASGYLPLVSSAMDVAPLKTAYEETPLMKDAADFMNFGIQSPQGKAKAACDKAVNDYSKLIWSEIDTPIEDIVEQVTEKTQFEIEANQ